jgi:hypothetical protein
MTEKREWQERTMALLLDLRDGVKQTTEQFEEHGDLERAKAALARPSRRRRRPWP